MPHRVSGVPAIVCLLLMAGQGFVVSSDPFAIAATNPGSQSATVSANSWPMFRGGPDRSGYNMYEQTLKPPLELKWSYTTGEEVRSSPAVVDGIVFFGSSDRNMYAVRADTGALKWSYHTEGAIESSPAVDNGAVFFGSEDGKVYALGAETGTLVWSYHTGKAVVSSPAVVNGLVYVGSSSGKLYALQASSGEVVWSFNAGGAPYSSPAVVEDAVFFAGEKTLYALEAATGSLLWTTELPNGSFDSSPAVAAGVVYIWNGPNLSAYDARTGDIIWSYATWSGSPSSPAISQGTVYFASFDYKVYALNATTGSLKWTYTTGNIIVSSPSVANGIVYIGSNDGKFYGLRAETGGVAWVYDIGQSIQSSPAIASGAVYVGSMTRKLYAFTSAHAPTSAPTIAFSPSSFSFTTTKGRSNPGSQTLRIWNSGSGTLSWLVSDDAPYLSLSPTSGSSTGETDNISVSADISGMSAGSYSATITISASGATSTPQTVPVSLTINAPTVSAVHLRSRADDGSWINLGSLFVEGNGNLNLPADISKEHGSYMVIGAGGGPGSYNGYPYHFDRWETSGGVSVADPYSKETIMSVSGEGILTTVAKKFDFTLDLTPSSQKVTAGDATAYSFTVTATSIARAAQYTVDLTPSGIPPDSTHGINPNPVIITPSQPSASGTFTISTRETTPASTYSVTLTGSKSPLQRSKTVSLTVEPKTKPPPDLTIVDFTWSPQNPKPGDQVTFTYTEKNQGQSDAAAHMVMLYIDGQVVSSDDNPNSLAAGASLTRTFPDRWAATAGGHTALVKADSNSGVTESNEDNNIMQKTIGTKNVIATSLTITLNPSEIKENTKTTITIRGRLTRSDTGAGIADRPINLEWLGGMTTKTTDANGYYAHSTDVTYSKGTYQFTARFDGYETSTVVFQSSSASATLTVSEKTYTITFYTNPSSIGSIVFSGTTYTNGQSANYKGGSYPIAAGVPSGYSFDSWSVPGGVVVSDLSKSSTTATVSGSGSLTAIFKSTAKPDLTILDITWSPSSPKEGDGVTFSYVIKNQGEASSSAFATALYVDNNRIDISARTSLAAGETQTRQFTYEWKATAGSHTIKVVADDLSEVVESNENNNAMTKTLQASSITKSAEIVSASTDKSSYNPGETVTPSVVIRNTGNTALSGRINVDISDPSGKNVKAGVFSDPVSLGIGEQKTVSKAYWTVPSDAQLGTYLITVGLYDSSSGAQYDIEYRIASFSVQSIVSAQVTSFSPATGTYKPGDTATSSLRFKNTGNVKWTFYVGYSVQDKNGRWYDVTSSAVTLSPREESDPISLSWKVPNDPVEGAYKVVMAVWKFEPEKVKDQQALDYREQANSFVVQVGKVSTVLTLDSLPTQLRESDVVTFTGRLTRADSGAGIAGVTIKILDSDIDSDDLMASGTTNSSGHYRIDWTAKPMDPLDRRVEAHAKFEGTSVYESTRAPTSGHFTIEVYTVSIGRFGVEKRVYTPGQFPVFTLEITLRGDVTVGVWLKIFIVGPKEVYESDPRQIVVTSLLSGEETLRYDSLWKIPNDASPGTYIAVAYLYEENPSVRIRIITAKASSPFTVDTGKSYMEIMGSQNHKLIHWHVSAQDFASTGTDSLQNWLNILTAASVSPDIIEAVGGNIVGAVVELARVTIEETVTPSGEGVDLTIIQMAGPVGFAYTAPPMNVLDAVVIDAAFDFAQAVRTGKVAGIVIALVLLPSVQTVVTIPASILSLPHSFYEITIPTGEFTITASPATIGPDEETNVRVGLNLKGQSGYRYSVAVALKEDVALLPDRSILETVSLSGSGGISQSFRVKGSDLGYLTHVGSHRVYGEFKIAITTPKGFTVNIVLQTLRAKIDVIERRAAPLTVGIGSLGEIAPSGDVDRYSFDAVAGTTYIIQTSDLRGVDTVVDLLSADGRKITSDDDSGGGRASKIVWTCQSSGTYYLEVKDYYGTQTGTYTIMVSKSFTGLSFDSALEITSGTYRYDMSAGEDHFFKINLQRNQKINITLQILSNADYDLYLHGPSRARLASSVKGTGVTDSITYTATSSGFHYIRVRYYSGDSGKYTLTVSVSPGVGTAENVELLAKVIASEAGSVWDVDRWVRCTDEERSAIGWTVLSRLRSGTFGNSIQEVVRGQYAYNQDPIPEIRDLARRLLEGQIEDPTGGATHFFSPISTPWEGDEGKYIERLRKHFKEYDTQGGLREVPGITKRVYFPSWARDLVWVGDLPNVRRAYFMFYRSP